MLDKKQPDIAVIAEYLRPVLQRLNRDKVPTKLAIGKEAGIIKIYSRDCNISTKASAGLLYLNYHILLQNIIHMP